MALAALVISSVILSELMKYSSLYIFGALLSLSIGLTLYLHFSLSIGLTLYLHYINYVGSLPERCNGAGLMSDLSVNLCRAYGYSI